MPIHFTRNYLDANYTAGVKYGPDDGSVTLDHPWMEAELVKRGVAQWEGPAPKAVKPTPVPEPKPEPVPAVFTPGGAAAAAGTGLTTADFLPGAVINAADVKDALPAQKPKKKSSKDAGTGS